MEHQTMSGRDYGVRESTVRRNQTVRSEDLKEDDLQGNSEKSQPTDETKDDTAASNDFLVNGRWFHLSSPGRTSSSTLRAERRNIPFSTEVNWRDQDYARKFGLLYNPGRVARKTYWRLSECRCWSKFVRFLERIHKAHSI